MLAHEGCFFVDLGYSPGVANASAAALRTTQSLQKKAREMEDCGNNAPLHLRRKEMVAANNKVTTTCGG